MVLILTGAATWPYCDCYPLLSGFLPPFYLALQNIYVCNSRQLKRIESVSRSPIFSHFSETLNGVNCIRAYGLTEQYAQINDNRLDENNSAVYSSNLAQR